MHELGIVFYIIRDVKAAAEEHHVDKVSGVVMNIGEVSTIVPAYLTDCWRWAADKEPLLTGSELKTAEKNMEQFRMERHVLTARGRTLGCCGAMKWRVKKLKYQIK